MRIQTDWERARKLADYICSLGEFKHDIFLNGIEQPYDSDGICLYTDGGYVSCHVKKDGKETLQFSCHEQSFDVGYISQEKQNFSDIQFPDLKKLDRVYRKMLKPMERTAKARTEQQKKEKIAELKKELKILKETK